MALLSIPIPTASQVRFAGVRVLEPFARWRRDEEPWLTGDSVARFRDPATRTARLAGTPALLEEPTRTGDVPRSFRARPTFSKLGPIRMIRFEPEKGTSYYGTGEVAGPLRRNGTTTVCWNNDSFAYDDRTPSLYQSHPWVLAVRADGTAYGVLVETTYRCQIDLHAGIVFRCEGPPPAVTVIERAHPAEVVRELAELTGKMPMPPKWALGYQQCRWSYETEERILKVAGGFRERSMPCDVIWFDIDYMDGFRCFTFDSEAFPDPARVNRKLHDSGFKTVWMIDPGLKVDEDYEVYRDGAAGGHYVQDKSGREYHGVVWPGDCAFPDYTRAETRAWWAGLYKDFLAHGIDGVWNDMNEPAVFHAMQVINLSSKTMPSSNIHRADEELGGQGSHARYHNIYGMQMARATRDGIQAARPDRRPFVLTRANHLGGQRYAATWTGDNESDWRHLRWSITMALNLGVSGQPFAGPDIGGFNGDASAELFARWMGIGALLPFARGHSIKESVDHEPWSFGRETERACRLALERRYRLLPYFYTLFREAHDTGMPVVRPLFFADPTDTRLRAVDDAFLLGGDVLVRSSGRPGHPTDRRSPVPKGRWSVFELAEASDAQLPELHLRAGAIVPAGPPMQFTDEVALDPLTLLVSLDEHGRASGTLYEDEGDGYGFQNGAYLLSRYEAVRTDRGVEVSLASSEGDMARPTRAVVVRVLDEDGGVSGASGRDGETVVVPG